MPEVELVVPDLVVLDAALRDAPALARELGCAVADGWNGFPGALRRVREAASAEPASVRWGPRLFLVPEPRTLVGWGGFKGEPRGGVVELGYEIAPDWAGRGLASAAVEALLVEAFSAAEVQAVVAHTRPEPGASVRVLEKNGFVCESEVTDDEVGRAWRFRFARPQTAPPVFGTANIRPYGPGI